MCRNERTAYRMARHAGSHAYEDEEDEKIDAGENSGLENFIWKS